MTTMTHSRPWLALASHYREIAHLSMRDLFSQDPLRFQNFSLQCCDILLDYSKNRITKETLQLLIQLAEQSDLRNWMERMFGGEKVNGTEDRAALHTALRNRASTPVYVNGKDVMPDVNQVLEKIRRFSNGIRQGSWLGYTGKPMSDVVNIGIGGSDLGPAMVTSALRPYCGNPRVHFVSNVDGAHLATTLEALSPETTLFVVASKTFTTQETLLNAHSARQWFLSQAISPSHVAKHFVAISTNRNEVVKFGIDSEHIFEFWDWVGGRYSLWSAIGLPIAIAIGMEHFDELLQGAHDMDKHFQYAPFDKNMPVILGLLGIWYTNFFGAQNQAVLPYDQNMQHFVAYLQQMLMESTGKTVTRNGLPVGCDTGPVIWGGVGTNGQHAFYQLIHQGTPLIPADFVAPIESHYSLEGHHTILLSHFIAQTEALMNGRTASETHAEMVQSGLSDEVIERLLPHRVFSGNKPTNTLLLKKLTPRALGSLLALYEHRTFVQSVIWDINAFDQWGVELGKQLAYRIQSELTGNTPAGCHDSSTQGLIEICRKHRS